VTLPARMTAAELAAWRAAGEPSAWPPVAPVADQRQVRRERRRDEDLVQRAIVDWLRLVEPRLAAPWCGVPNGGARSPIEAALLQGLGVVAGAPDLVFVRAGLEVKRPGGGRLSPAQREFRAGCERRGVPYAVVRSLDEAIAAVEGFGLLKEVSR
jgi:hypothetical protein